MLAIALRVVTSSFAGPLVFQAGAITEIECPADAKKVWLNYLTEGEYVLPIQRTNGIAFVQLTNQFVGWGSHIVASRLWIDKRWSSIAPALIGRLPRARDLTQTGFVLASIKQNEATRFGFTAQKDTSVWFNVFANRLGSQLDPVLRIVDKGGRELAFCDDDIAAGRDAMIYFKPPRDGTFNLEVRDIANGGSADYGFCLEAHLDSAVPYFPFIELRTPGDYTTIRTTNVLATGTGSFRPGGIANSIPFNIQADERLIVSAETRLFGSPCDAAIAVYDSNHRVVAESIGSGLDGPSITNKFPAGRYNVDVREISKLSGQGIEYCFKVERMRPGVVLTTDVERVEFSKEGEAKMKIACKRYDYDGPVKLEVDGLVEGVSVEDAVIPAGKNETELKLKRAKDVDGFQVRINGEIEQKDAKTTKESFPVSTMPALRKLFPLQMFPCAAMDGWIAVNPPAP